MAAVCPADGRCSRRCFWVLPGKCEWIFGTDAPHLIPMGDSAVVLKAGEGLALQYVVVKSGQLLSVTPLSGLKTERSSCPAPTTTANLLPPPASGWLTNSRSRWRPACRTQGGRAKTSVHVVHGDDSARLLQLSSRLSGIGRRRRFLSHVDGPAQPCFLVVWNETGPVTFQFHYINAGHMQKPIRIETI